MLSDNTQLARLLDHLQIDVALVWARLPKHGADITKLSIDSRQADTHTLFLALLGSQSSGHDYIAQAAQSGCILAFLDTANENEHGLISQRSEKSEQSITCILVKDLQAQLANIAYLFYTGKLAQQQVLSDLPLISAVTGTNGKTSVAALMSQLYSLCQQQCASIGTLGVNLFTQGQTQKISQTINTTPDIVSLITTLASLKKQGCARVVLEASSHGLTQNRLSKLNIGCAVFTNLSQDHLDYHGSMTAYGQAKRKLLQAQGLEVLVLNGDDEESLKWQQDALAKQKIYWFSLQSLSTEKQGCWASDIHYSTKGISMVLHARFSKLECKQHISVALIGAFNVANLLAAVTALFAQGLSFTALVKATQSISGVAGRMELFPSAKASVLVDYAHTPDALKQALMAARVHTQGKLSCVFGCGGNRDTSKRAIMGSVAQQYADNIVLTQDNSRNEDPSAIVADIQNGIRSLASHQTLSVELDREQALQQTWQASRVGDMILMAGKGHEDYLEINNQRLAYNEREVVRALTCAVLPSSAEVKTNATSANAADSAADNAANSATAPHLGGTQ